MTNTQTQIPDIIEIYRGESRCHTPNEKAVLWSLNGNDAFREAAETGNAEHAKVISALIHRGDIEEMPHGRNYRIRVSPGKVFDVQEAKLVDSGYLEEMGEYRLHFASVKWGGKDAGEWFLRILYSRVYNVSTEQLQIKELILQNRSKAAAMSSQEFDRALKDTFILLLFAVKIVAESVRYWNSRQDELSETEWRVLLDWVLTRHFGEADGETDGEAEELQKHHRLLRTGYLKQILQDAELLTELQRLCKGPEYRRLQIESSRHLIADAVLRAGPV